MVNIYPYIYALRSTTIFHKYFMVFGAIYKGCGGFLHNRILLLLAIICEISFYSNIMMDIQQEYTTFCALLLFGLDTC